MMDGQKQTHFFGKKQERRDRIAKMLHLTDDQKKQIKALHDEAKKKMEALKNDQNITLKEFYNRSTAIRKEMREKRAAILTKEQTNQIANIKTEREKRRKERFEQHLIHMKYELELSENQVKEIQKVHARNAESIQKIKSEESINDHDKKVKIKSLRAGQKEEMKKIFTADQLKKIDEIKLKTRSKKRNNQK